jgi:acetyl-CoA synthetase
MCNFQHVFDYQPGDKFGCVADIGWITGHTYACYGPLLNGGTSLLFESTPTYPDPGNSIRFFFLGKTA